MPNVCGPSHLGLTQWFSQPKTDMDTMPNSTIRNMPNLFVMHYVHCWYFWKHRLQCNPIIIPDTSALYSLVLLYALMVFWSMHRLGRSFSEQLFVWVSVISLCVSVWVCVGMPELGVPTKVECISKSLSIYNVNWRWYKDLAQNNGIHLSNGRVLSKYSALFLNYIRIYLPKWE